MKFAVTFRICWFFTGIVSQDYSLLLTYWHPEYTGAVDPHQCSLCKTYHNKSVHGYFRHCGGNSEVVQFSLQATGSLKQKVMMWDRVAVARDLHIVGRLLLPCSSVSELAQQDGTNQCKRADNKFMPGI